MEIKKFTELGLSEEILRAIQEIGYETPTPIQSECIPVILNNQDVIGHSQTGTGKTMAFGIPGVEMINPMEKCVQMLVLCPTRELAMQANVEITKIIKYKEGIKTVAVYGGAPIVHQMRAIKQGAQIVVGTPGRIMDHMRRRTLKLGGLKLMVLDEADEMLNMGFREDIEIILQDVPEERVTVLFSATMSKSILNITKNYQHDAKFVKTVTEKLTVASIDQWFCRIPKNSRINAMLSLIAYHKPQLSLVFCNTKRQVDELVEQLQQLGSSAVALHGDLNQHARTRVMGAFRSGAIPILVATDVAARGIDVDDIGMVFNFDIPIDNEYYVHRIGRTGRAGREGKAVTFSSSGKQDRQMRDIQRFIKTKLEVRPLPSRSDIIKINNEEFVAKLVEEVNNKKYGDYFPIVNTLEEQGYDMKDVVAALINMNMSTKNNISEVKQGSMHTSRNESSGSQHRSSRKYKNTGAEAGMTRFFINLGKKDKVAPRDFVGCIAGETGINGREVGKIDIFENFTFVEVPQDRADHVLESLQNVKLRGRKLSIEPAKAKKR